MEGVEQQSFVGEQHRAHIADMFTDRSIDKRTTFVSVESCRAGTKLEPRLLHIRIDGMDQSKYRVPRNLDSSKLFESAWRPCLHLTGVLCEGLCEIYFISEADCRKDANSTCHILARALDLIKETLLRRGLEMPEHLSLSLDNTCRENKNQASANYVSPSLTTQIYVCKHVEHFLARTILITPACLTPKLYVQFVKLFLAYLQCRGLWKTISVNYFRVGHTHNYLDQRFSIIKTLLSRARVLETPQEGVFKTFKLVFMQVC